VKLVVRDRIEVRWGAERIPHATTGRANLHHEVRLVGLRNGENHTDAVGFYVEAPYPLTMEEARALYGTRCWVHGRKTLLAAFAPWKLSREGAAA
jgi:hypothetical protein